jgi:hypothetical protein
LLSAAAYLLFLFAFVEVSLQAFYYFTAGDFLFKRVGLPIYVTDPWAGMWNRPNLSLHHRTNEFEATYHTNAAGLRVPEPAREYAAQKDPETFRVLLLGPSFAFGWGVDWEESFAGHLGAFLEEGGFAGGRRVEVVNAGVPSLPPGPGLRWFDHVGSGLHPDLVIQFVYGSMAVPDAERINGSVDEDGYLVPADASTARLVRERVKKLATVFYGWVLWTRFETLRAGDQAAPSGEVLGAGRELHQAADFDPASPEAQEALGFYRRFVDSVRRAGGAPLLVYFPLSYAVHPEDVARWKHLGVLDAQRQIAYDAAFVRYLGDLGIPCVDATAALREAAATQRLYYWLDIHWTPAGNRVTARAVADRLLADRAGAG